MAIFELLGSSIAGYVFNRLATKPQSRLNRKFPVIKIKNVQIFPSLIINLKNRKVHLHHWLGYSIILVITLTFNVGALDAIVVKGYLAGSIIQGFTYPDWKKVIRTD